MVSIEHASRERADSELLPRSQSGQDVALHIDAVSKTFHRASKKAKSSRSKGTLRERISWRGLREGLAAHAARHELKRVVDDITLTVHGGEVLGILGPNGCGKSTLVRMISTLLIPDKGHISVFGYDVVQDAHAVKCLINRVSVDAAFFKKLSALENLLYTARLYDIDSAAAVKKASGILDQLGFDPEHLDNSMEQLSRGQQQKVAIARAFLTSPRLVLLDEPTTGLDPKSKRDVETFIRQVRAEQDVTILLTTHDMAEAEALCGRIALLNRGKMVGLGTVDELKSKYRKPGDPVLPTLEAVFITIAGETMEQADEVEETVS